jgi:putative aldouronate transport system permease protein
MEHRLKTQHVEWFSIINAVLLLCICLIFVIPFLMVLSTSFITEQEAMRRGAFILFPEKFDFTAYKLILSGKASLLLNGYKITFFRVFAGTFCNLLLTSMMAYGLAKRTLPGKNLITTFVFITMIFSGGLIPSFMLMDFLGLRNSVWALVFPSLVSAWNMFIMRTFFMNIPQEIEECAFIDGANPPTILLKIIFPISLPAFATIGLFYAVWHWNAWFDAAIYIDDVRKYPVQMYLRNFLLNNTFSEEFQKDDLYMPPAETLKSAAIIVCTVPILVVYPFIQKYFVKGALVGSIKG